MGVVLVIHPIFPFLHLPFRLIRIRSFFQIIHSMSHCVRSIVFDDTILPNLPEMYTFPNLGGFYQTWAKDLHVKGVDIRWRSLVAILERV